MNWSYPLSSNALFVDVEHPLCGADSHISAALVGQHNLFSRHKGSHWVEVVLHLGLVKLDTVVRQVVKNLACRIRTIFEQGLFFQALNQSCLMLFGFKSHLWGNLVFSIYCLKSVRRRFLSTYTFWDSSYWGIMFFSYCQKKYSATM